MKRRNFLKSLGAISVVTIIPIISTINFKENIIGKLSINGYGLNIPVSDDQITVLEFHRILCVIFEDENFITFPAPSVRLTDNIVELNSGYTINLGGEKFLCGGSLISGDDIYISNVVIGHIDYKK